MKTYVLTVSRYFPKTHKRAGEETNFENKLLMGLQGFNNSKIHTIRSNYNLWEKRISEIQRGNAILSIRYWSGKPYNSKQVEICQLNNNSGIGIQKIDSFMWQYAYVVSNSKIELVDIETLAKNDGLSIENFVHWFKGYDLSQQMAIIHFTNFRY